MENNSPSRYVLKDLNNAGILIQQQQQQQQQQHFKNSTSPLKLNDASIDIENKPIKNKLIEEASIKSQTKTNIVEAKSPIKSTDINLEKDNKGFDTSLKTKSVENTVVDQALNNSLPDIVNVVPAITLSGPNPEQNFAAGEFKESLQIDTIEKSFTEDEQEFLTPKLTITEASNNSSDDEIFTECHSSPLSDIESPSTTAIDFTQNNNTVQSMLSGKKDDISKTDLTSDATTKTNLKENKNSINIFTYDNMQVADSTTKSENSQDSIDFENSHANVHQDKVNDIDLSLINNIFSNLKINTSELQTTANDESLLNINTNPDVSTTQLNDTKEINDLVKNKCPEYSSISLEEDKSGPSTDINFEPENNSNLELNIVRQKENCSLPPNKDEVIPFSDSEKEIISTEISLQQNDAPCMDKENKLSPCAINSECIVNDISNSSSSSSKNNSDENVIKLSQIFDAEDAELNQDSFLENERRALNLSLDKSLKNQIPIREESDISSAVLDQNNITVEISAIPENTAEVLVADEKVKLSEILGEITNSFPEKKIDSLNSQSNLDTTIDLSNKNSIDIPSNVNYELIEKGKDKADLIAEMQSIQDTRISNEKESSPMVDSIENALIKSTNSEMFDSLEQQKSISRSHSSNNVVNDKQSDNAPNFIKSSETLNDTFAPTNVIEKNPQFDQTFDQLTFKSPNTKFDYSNLYETESTRSITPTDLNLTKDITRSESIDELNKTHDVVSAKESFDKTIVQGKICNSTVKSDFSDLNNTFNINSRRSIPIQNNQTFCGDIDEPMDVDMDSIQKDCENLNVTHNVNDHKQEKLVNEDMFKIPKNISNGKKTVEMANEEFNSNGMILNPSDFDFLLTKGSNDIIPDNRDSLLLKFDPLVGRPVLANQIQQSAHDAKELHKLKRTSQKITQVLESEEELQTSNKSLVNLSSSETVSLQENNLQPSIESLKQKAAEKLNKLKFDKKGNDKMSVDVIQDLNITSDIKSINSINPKEINDKKLFKMEELETKVQNEVGKTEDLEKKLKESEQREEALLKRITEKDKTIAKLGGVIEAYEKAIAEAIAEKEQLTQSYEQQLQEIKNDRDLNYQHLASLESTFADLHVKYERSKQTTAKLRASEEELLAEKKQNLENLHLQEQRYEKMKNHAMQQLDIANNKLEFLTKNHAMEITKLKALLKKEEISKASVSEQLQQKSRENEELMKICDELINGGQNS